MSELLRTILIMSISGSILALLLFALKPLIKNRLPKSVQYYLWLVVVAALLIPISRLISLPQASDSSPLAASPVSIVDRFAITTTENAERIAAIPATPEEKEPDYRYALAVKQAESPVAPAIDVFMFVYPLGAVAALLYHIIAYVVYLRKIRRGNKTTDAVCTIPVYRNEKTATPMLIGVFHPVIVLPDREYTEAQLRAVLLHELTHLRRKDVIVKWLSLLACAAHWFNPIVWLVRREIDRTCELACDESVIRDLDAEGKQNYGDTLIYVAADTKTPHAILSTTMCEEKKTLRERLEAIMKSKRHTRLAGFVSLVLIFATGCTAVAFGAGSRDLVENEDFNVEAYFSIPSGVEHMSTGFMDIIKSGTYYIRYAPLATRNLDGSVRIDGDPPSTIEELAVDGENEELIKEVFRVRKAIVEELTADGEDEEQGKVSIRIEGSDLEYEGVYTLIHMITFRDGTHTINHEYESYRTRESREPISAVSTFSRFSYNSSGTSAITPGVSDEAVYDYDEYTVTVGEVRDIMGFSEETPDDGILFLRVYYSGGELYAFSYGTSERFSISYVIYDFSQKIPDKFTFEVPAGYESLSA